MNNAIEIYSSQDGSIQLNVKLENDTVWLNRQQMAELFGRDYKTISKHINNALHEELEGEPVVAKFATTKNYGRIEGFTQEQMVEYFSLEMITSVGFRVKSKQGVAFRKWANSVLKQYLIKGYAIKAHKQLGHPKILMYSKPLNTTEASERLTSNLKQILNEEDNYWIGYCNIEDIRSSFQEHLQYDIIQLLRSNNDK